jgi:hypothetical protein
VSIDNAGGAQTRVLTETLYAEKKSPADRGRTCQLLFDQSGSRLLVYGTMKCQVLSLPDGAVLAEHWVQDGDSSIKWQQHPSEPDHLLCFTAKSIAVFPWDDLEEELSIPLDLSESGTEAKEVESTLAIDAILDSHHPHFLLLRTVTTRVNRPSYGFVVLHTQQLYDAPLGESAEPGPSIPAIKPLSLPSSLVSTVAHAVGILPDGRLVFLDRRLWVCTTAAPAPATRSLDVRPHFFIPHDWVTAQGLRQCRVLRDGAFLCPSKGEVAVMKGDLVQDW